MSDTMLPGSPGTRRRSQLLLGALLIVLGAVGLSFTLAGPAIAGASPDRHGTMHEMMDAMHGEGTAERMHAVDGGEQMMDDCAEMMGTTSSMGSMMGRGG